MLYDIGLSVFYVFGLWSNIGHDLVMLTLWKYFEIVRVLTILQVSAAIYYVSVTIPPHIPVGLGLSLSWLVVIFQDGVN